MSDSACAVGSSRRQPAPIVSARLRPLVMHR